MSRRKNDIQAVVAYLSSLWGLASGLSLLFPLSNVLLQAVPSSIFVELNPKTSLTPTLLTTLATIYSLFSTMLLVSTRREIAAAGILFDFRLREMRSSAVRAFVTAVVLLFIYLFVCGLIRSSYDKLPVLAKLCALLFVFIAYPFIFSTFTKAFTALGLREYLLEQREENEAVRTSNLGAAPDD